MRAVGYAWVSAKDQVRDGLSLEAQQAKLEAYCLVKDWTLLPILRDEGYTAKHLKRPGLEASLALVDADQVEVVIVSKLDRLTCSVADLDRLMKRFERSHTALVSLQESLDTTTATGRWPIASTPSACRRSRASGNGSPGTIGKSLAEAKAWAAERRA